LPPIFPAYGGAWEEACKPLAEGRIVCIAVDIESKLGGRRLTSKLGGCLRYVREVKIRRGKGRSELNHGGGLRRRFRAV